MARPAINRVGSGGRPRLSVYTAPNLLFQEAPVDRPRELRQRVIHVDDLVEPRTKQILLAAVPLLPWSHPILRSRIRGAQNQSFRFA